jgi:hypothetical protein
VTRGWHDVSVGAPHDAMVAVWTGQRNKLEQDPESRFAIGSTRRSFDLLGMVDF